MALSGRGGFQRRHSNYAPGATPRPQADPQACTRASAWGAGEAAPGGYGGAGAVSAGAGY